MDGSKHSLHCRERMLELYSHNTGITYKYIGKACTYLGMDKLYFGRVSICILESSWYALNGL